MFGLRLLRLQNWSLVSRQSVRLASSKNRFSFPDRPIRDAPVPPAIMQQNDTPRQANSDAKRRRKAKDEGSGKPNGFDEVMQVDIDRLIRQSQQEANGETQHEQVVLPERFSEIEVDISELSSTGDGLGLSADGRHVYVVPFTVPGDKALVKVVRHHPPLNYSMTDFIKVLSPGPQRNDAGIGCKYFGQCSGCQLQMLSYEDQLAHKKRIVEKAYANFSGLIPEMIPAVDETFGSPLQYGYRTKLTPHFLAPGGGRRRKAPRDQSVPVEVPPIGYTFKNRKMDMDIEDCPLGTDIVRRGLKTERKRVADNIQKYTKGATLLMRESTIRIPKDRADTNAPAEEQIEPQPDAKGRTAESGDVIRVEKENYIQEKRCVTDHNATSIEYIDDYIFTNKAGAFFQNNNSILSGFTEYIRQHALPPDNEQDPKPIKYLLDAYSGSGLFTITLSPLFKSSLGVDVDPHSIASARDNARDNNLPNTGFAANDAATLFKDVPYPPDQTLLVIDPPRKGCSEDFLRQLLQFGPRRVVYVSCNVHTQARDVAVMVNGDANIRYDIESIRGFDFFPQTGHVEGVAILNKAHINKDV